MQLAYAMPIIEGKTQRVRDQAKEYDEHKARYEALNTEATVTRHSVWIQETPMGDFEVSVMEVDDPTKMRLHFSSDDYDTWWRGFVKDTHGFDPEDVADDFQLPEPIYATARGGAGPEKSLAFVLPVVAGKAEEMKALGRQLAGEKAADHRKMSDELGLDGENWYLQRSPMGDAVVAYFEGSDLQSTFDNFTSKSDEYVDWFKARLMETTGVDWNQPAPPPPDLVFDWRK